MSRWQHTQVSSWVCNAPIFSFKASKQHGQLPQVVTENPRNIEGLAYKNECTNWVITSNRCSKVSKEIHLPVCLRTEINICTQLHRGRFLEDEAYNETGWLAHRLVIPKISSICPSRFTKCIFQWGWKSVSLAKLRHCSRTYRGPKRRGGSLAWAL